MTRFLSQALALLLAGWLAACAGGDPAPALTAQDGPTDRTLWVVSNGWHTTVVLTRADLERVEGAPPEIADLPTAPYLEFSWGDQAYFQRGDQSLGAIMAAAMTPTPAVLHLAGLKAPPPEVFPHLEVYPLAVSREGLQRLATALSAEFVRKGGARAAPTGPGRIENSFFYDAPGKFHLFNTCNTWTARMLRTAGVRVGPGEVMTADDLTKRLAPIALGGP